MSGAESGARRRRGECCAGGGVPPPLRGERRGEGGGAERESGAEGVAAGWGGESGAVGWRKYRESGMDGCTEGESGAEGGVVSPPASARPAENLGDREGGSEKELVPGWWVVAGGEYGVGSRLRCERGRRPNQNAQTPSS